MEFLNYLSGCATMSDPFKCLTLGRSPCAHSSEGSSRADTERTVSGRRLSDSAVRLIENWVVGVVTVLSAGVIFVTLLAHHSGTALSDPPGQVTIDAGAIRH